MNWKICFIIIVMCLVSSCKEKIKKELPVTSSDVEIITTEYVNRDHLIEAEELQNLLSEPKIKIVHFGKPAQYKKNHIKGSVNVWRNEIEDVSHKLIGMMCSKEQLENLFSRLGINNSDTVIVYDEVAGADAARLWWVLKNYGFNKIKILNGGITKWNEIGGALTTEYAVVKKSKFKLAKNPPMTFYATKEEVVAAVNSKSTLIIDTRTLDEYTGIRQKRNAKAPGHIPNSFLIDYADCVNFYGNKKFKNYTELKMMYDKITPNKEQLIITYCHSGVRSAHTAFVLTELLGYKNVKNYDGSWIEWSQFEDLPKKKNSITTVFQ